MAKFTQTLTASQYTASDLSNLYKTALDNLGWGTGKVDIAGGYRFTATEEANSETTPLVLTDVLDSSQGRYFRPVTGPRKNGWYTLAAYLPGVKDFRVNYTVLTTSESILPTGTVVSNSDKSRIDLRLSYVSMQKLIANSAANNPNYGHGNPISSTYDITPTSVTVGQSYSTPWSSSLSTDYILGNTCLSGYIKGSDSTSRYLYIRIDSIEYKVRQNKFAFQSPNLDSPTFEINVLDNGGVTSAILSTIPYKNAKLPIARVGFNRISVLNPNNSLFTGVWGRILFNTSVRLNEHSTFGQTTKPYHFDNMYVNFSRANDIQIYVASNNNYKGILFTLKNGSTQNSLVLDTVDKSSAYALSVPQKPQFRVNRLANTTSQLLSMSYSYANYIQGFGGGELFYIRNACTLSDIVLTQEQLPYYAIGTVASVDYKIYSVTKDGNDYKMGSFLGEASAINNSVFTAGIGYKVKANMTTPISIPAGTYILVTAKGYEYSSMTTGASAMDPAYMATVDTNTNASSRIAEGVYIGSIQPNLYKTLPLPIAGSIRYIRDYLNGSTANSGNHWVEIQAFDQGGTNVALNKPVSGAGSQRPNSVITNGNFSDANEWTTNDTNGGNYITIDLGQTYNLTSLKIWHYYGDARSYNTWTEVSQDGTTWYRVYDSVVQGTYQETSSGRMQLLDNYLGTVSTGDIIYTQVPSSSNLLMDDSMPSIELVLTGTETPTRNIQFFGEDWVVVGDANRISGIFDSNNAMSGSTSFEGLYTSNIGGYAMFGVDPAMTLRWKGIQRLNIVSGRAGGRSGYSQWYYGTTPSAVLFGNGNIYYEGRAIWQGWLTRANGAGLKLNNTFIWFGPKAPNTSFTSPDGTEYFCTNRFETASLLFRIKP